MPPLVKIDLRPFNRFAAKFHAQMQGAPGPINDFWKQLADRALTFWLRRFDRFSRGGGDWAPLAPATIRGRRQGVSKVRVGRTTGRKERGGKQTKRGGGTEILKDTGQMRKGLLKGSPGNLIMRIPGGIRVGIGGGAGHSDAPMTIGRLAEIHNEGLGRVPKREIVTNQLSEETKQGIRFDIKRAIFKLGKSSERG